MIIYGWNPVREALRSHPERIRRILVSGDRRLRHQDLLHQARAAGIAVEVAGAKRIGQFVPPGAVHNGVAAEVADGSYADFETMVSRTGDVFTLVLDGVTDPRNLGAILRVGDAFGVSFIVVPRHESAGLTPVAIKASAGAAAWVPITQVTNLARAIERLKDAGFWVWGTDPRGRPPDEVDLGGRVAIVLGGEGRGIRPNVRRHCDGMIAIPMRGRVESLNVATAAAILAWETSRRRR